MKKREENVFCEKIYKQKGVTKIELQCWLQIQKEFDLIEYQRYISNFQKSIKKEIFNLKTEYKDEYEYFVDLNIRNSPSKTAFVSIEISLFKNSLINKVSDYPQKIKSIIENYPHVMVFYNDKKRKPKAV